MGPCKNAIYYQEGISNLVFIVKIVYARLNTNENFKKSLFKEHQQMHFVL
jgi:hypothetical protein